MLKPPKTTHKSSKRGSKQIRTSGRSETLSFDEKIIFLENSNDY
jgi:hypothetical protein